MENEKIKKYTIKLNSVDKIEQLLQETYDLSCQQYTQIQNEINKIANTTVLNLLDIDGKEKYGKIMNNYITLQQKAIAQKFDIAKLMSEIVKRGGDVKGAVDDMSKSPSTLNFDKLKEIAKNCSTTNTTDMSQHYEIKGK